MIVSIQLTELESVLSYMPWILEKLNNKAAEPVYMQGPNPTEPN